MNTNSHCCAKPKNSLLFPSLGLIIAVLVIIFRGAHGNISQAQSKVEEDSSGSDDCPCIDPSSILSSIVDCVTDTGKPGFFGSGDCYPLDYGKTCGAHDMTYDPTCWTDGNRSVSTIPAYCHDRWCYVDFKKCKTGSEFFYRSSFADDSKALKTNLFYSYTTCSSTADRWLNYQSKSSVDQVTLQVTIPTMFFPYHFKYTEEGNVATDTSYYYNDSVPWVGSIIDYLNAVVEISNMHGINFTSRSVIADKAYPESSYTASVHDVSAGISDAGASPFWITSQRLSMTTFSTPFHTDRLDLFVEQPEQQKQTTVQASAEKIMMPFTTSLWMLLFGVVLTTAILIVWLDRSEGDKGIWNETTSGPHWDKSSTLSKLGILLRSLMHSFIIHSAHLLGQSVEFNPFTSMKLKIIYFGFALVIFIAVAAYTANLAAFLTLSGTVNYVANMEDAIATNTPVCATPVLKDELAATWPGATFIFSEKPIINSDDDIMGILELYDEGKCGAIGYSFAMSGRTNQKIMNEFCKRELVSTGSFILEKPVALPVRGEYAAGLSYWLYEAEKQSISFQFFHEQRLPSPLCNFRVSRVSSDVNELLSLTPESMILPTLVWLSCIAAAILLRAFSTKKKIKRIASPLDQCASDGALQSSDCDSTRKLPRLSYLSTTPSLRDRRSVCIDYRHSDNREVSDLLKQHHTEMMRHNTEMMQMLFEIKSSAKRESTENVNNEAALNPIVRIIGNGTWEEDSPPPLRSRQGVPPKQTLRPTSVVRRNSLRRHGEDLTPIIESTPEEEIIFREPDTDDGFVDRITHDKVKRTTKRESTETMKLKDDNMELTEVGLLSKEDNDGCMVDRESTQSTESVVDW